jgi:hypothetical protein
MEITLKKLLGIFWLLNTLFHLYRVSLLLESLGQEFFFNNLFFKILYTYILIVYFSYFVFIYTEKNIKINIRYKINLLIGFLGVPLLVYYFYFLYLEISPLSLGQYFYFIFYKEPLVLWSFIQNVLLLITISVFIKDGYIVIYRREN